MNEKEYLHQDQDVLNEVFNDSIGVLPPEWNWETISEREISEADEIFKDYGNIKNPKVIHYFARHKPWNVDITRLKHQYWWQYARLSPYYEQILGERWLRKINPLATQVTTINNKLHEFGSSLMDLPIQK